MVLLAITVLYAGPGWPALARSTVKDCNLPTTGLTPLTDLGQQTYLDNEGGLYPGGQNTVPEEHLADGMERAAEVAPRLADGTVDPDGVIVVISIGVSNTQMEFEAFAAAAVSAPEVNRDLVFVNGAQVGRALGLWASTTNDSTWERVSEELAKADVTPEQVQVAWVMLPSRSRGPRTLEDARDEVPDLVQVLQDAKKLYPNLHLAYISSRIYGGYIADIDSEPNAYHHGFTVKWFIERQIMGSADLNADPVAGPPLVPWLSWGPYLWADGTNPRSDGLIWVCDDFAPEGVHPSESAQRKVADLLMGHFKADPTAANWFVATETSGPEVVETTTTGSALETITTSTEVRRPQATGSTFVWSLAGVVVLLGVAMAVYRRVRQQR